MRSSAPTAYSAAQHGPARTGAMRPSAPHRGIGFSARPRTAVRGQARPNCQTSAATVRNNAPASCIALRGPMRALLVAAVLPFVLTTCGSEPEVAAFEGRPVRTVVAEKREAGAPIVLSGRIEAEDEVTLAFRISGRLLENSLRLGDRIEP